MEDILAGMIRTAAPILLAALGGVLCERSGVFNIALEGMMLLGAFFGVFGVYITGSVLMAVIFAMLAGAIAGLSYVSVVEGMKADPTIVSIGLNVLSVGVTTYLMKMVFGDKGSVGSSRIIGLPQVNIPFLENIPFLGKVLNGHTVLVYISLILVAVVHFIIFKTYIGINLRAVGEKEEAASAAGISVRMYRIWATVAAGMLCGLAGVHLSLGYVTMFSENMTGGRGFFAFTAVVFGQANPVVVMIASFVFGIAEAITFRAQNFGLPSPLVLTVPYFITLVALVIRNIRIRKPTKEKTLDAVKQFP